MQALHQLLRLLPEPAKDARLNLAAVLQQTVLSAEPSSAGESRLPPR